MAKQTYVVSAAQHTVVHLDEKERILGVTRIKRGETVELEEGAAKRLLDTGGLMTQEDWKAATGQEVVHVTATGTLVTADQTPESVEPTEDPAAGAETLPAALSGQTADEGVADPDKSGGPSKAPAKATTSKN